MSYYLLRPTQLVRYKTRKKGLEQLASISLSLGCGASIINYSPRFLMTMFYYLVLLSTEKSSPHGCICPIFWVPDLLGQSFPPRKQDSETSPFRLFHSPAFAPPAELKQASNMLGWEIPPLWRKTPRTPMVWRLVKMTRKSKSTSQVLMLDGSFAESMYAIEPELPPIVAVEGIP